MPATQADQFLEWVIERADERLRRRREKEISRKSATRKDRAKRALLHVDIVEGEVVLTKDIVARLMGNKPEERFAFIQARGVRGRGVDRRMILV